LDEGIEAIKAFLLQPGVSVPLKKLTICFLLDQMQAFKSKPEISSLLPLHGNQIFNPRDAISTQFVAIIEALNSSQAQNESCA